MSNLANLKEEFDNASKIATQMSLDLNEMYQGLSKKEIGRVFMAVMEYPMKPTKPLISHNELDVYKLSVGLKETQMKLGMLNLAMKEIEVAHEESLSGNKEASDE